MTYRTVPTLLAGLAALAGGVGCGGGDDDRPQVVDAAPATDAGDTSDAGNPCGYQEADDGGNAVTAEDTGLSIGAGGLVICGQIEARAPVSSVVDRDRYRLGVGGASDVVVRLRAAGGRDVATLELNLNDGGSYLGKGYFIGSHGVFLAQLEPGTVTLEIVAGNPMAPLAAIPYEVEVVLDQRAARCPARVGNPSFTESGDTALNLHAGNDMVEVAFSDDTVAQTVEASDQPEPSNLVVTDGMSYKLAGVLALNGNAAGYADDYLDRDTFLIATGAQTTELAIRVSWPDVAGTTDDADLDFVLFAVPPSADAVPVERTAGAHGEIAPPELEATAVLPSSTYWLWVGNSLGSAQPKPYEITICGVDFTP